jgi:hypothetical protein
MFSLVPFFFLLYLMMLGGASACRLLQAVACLLLWVSLVWGVSPCFDSFLSVLSIFVCFCFTLSGLFPSLVYCNSRL